MNRNNNITFIDELPNLDDIEQKDTMQIPDEKYQKYIRGNFRMDPNSGMQNRMPDMINTRLPPSQQQEYIEPEPMNIDVNNKNYINCIDIVRHVQQCPICSRFYNNDKTVYILVIIVLCVICLLLLKKVLDV